MHRLFGVLVASELDLPLPAIALGRGATLEPVVDIVRGRVEARGEVIWRAESPIAFTCLSHNDETILEWSAARFGVTPDRVVVDTDDPDQAVVLLLQAVWSVLLSARQREALHGCTVERDGRALGIFGTSGSGKTTAGLALLDRGWRLVADDLLTFDDGARAVPGPPFIRLMPDQAVGRQGEYDAVGKLRFRPRVCREPVPLATMVVHAEAQTEVARLSGAAAVDAVLSHVYNDAVPFPGQARRRFELALDLAARVPIYAAPPRSLTAAQLEEIAEDAARWARVSA